MSTIPSSSAIWNKNFITYRRLWLDTLLDNFKEDMHGTVVDIGGKKGKKRGAFNPAKTLSSQWWYVNLDLSTNPNIYADAAILPLKNDSVDVIICTEVLEHLINPHACTNEIHRILKNQGIAFFSIPFLYPIHADPYDYQRFTADGLNILLSSFSSIKIYPMGGYLGTVGMFIEIGLFGITGQNITQKITRRSLTWLSRILYQADLKRVSNQPTQWSKFTTGFFIKAVK